MSFPNSAGVYDRIVDKSFVVNAGGVVAGAIVISADRGPTTINTVTSAREFVDTYGLPDRDHPSLYAGLRFLNRAGILTVLRVINDAEAASGTLEHDSDGNGTMVPHLDIKAANEGAWGNNITVSFADASAKEGTGRFTVTVKEDGVEVESFVVSRDTEAKNGYGQNQFIEDVINGNSDYITVTDYPAVTAAYDMSGSVSLSGGSDDTAPATSGDIVLGWDEFLNVEDVPATFLINAGFAVEEIQVKMVAVAQARKDCVAILDVPQLDNDDADAMVTYRDTLGINSYFGALYGGWLRVYDPYSDREVEVPPSGDVAAAAVVTIQDYEYWEAPAGVRRGIIPNALGVTKVFSEGERDLLYTNGVNPVTTFAGAAAIIWGQKTQQVQASALDRLNVVNTVLWLNQRMKEALQPFVFEPNNEVTRNNVNYILTSFLDNIKQRGGLYDFAVDTSTTINTPQVIDNNQLLVDVYIKPVRTAEFIRISTIVTPSGVTFDV